VPSALAVLRLMNSSTLVTCWTGRSAGFSPLRIRPKPHRSHVRCRRLEVTQIHPATPPAIQSYCVRKQGHNKGKSPGSCVSTGAPGPGTSVPLGRRCSVGTVEVSPPAQPGTGRGELSDGMHGGSHPTFR
jgi:hypothetical protein